MKSILLKAIAFFGCTACVPARSEAASGANFELGLIARDPNSTLTRQVENGGSGTILVSTPAMLTGSDIESVKSVTRSAWYMLSGRHRTTTLVLTLKPDAVTRVQNELRLAISRDDRFAMMLGGNVLAVVIGQHGLEGREFSIDASFFSSGTESVKERECQDLARRINSTLR